MELLPGMAAAGFIGLPVPAGYGGTGGGGADVTVLLEEFGRASLSIAPFLNRALADGDNFVIGGSKMFTSGTAESPCLIVSARTDPGATRQRGISVFLVDAKTLGITCRRIEKLGMRTAGTLCEVEYRGLRVPRSVLLGGLDQGWQVITGTLERARLAQAAYCVGGAQQAIDDALAHVRERSALAHSQALAHMLVGCRCVPMRHGCSPIAPAPWSTPASLACAKPRSPTAAPPKPW